MSLVHQPQEAEFVEDVDLASMSLDELAARINLGCVAVGRVLRITYAYGVQVGEALLEARSRHKGNGDWVAWCESNLETDYRTVAQYMRWAYYKDHLPTDGLASQKAVQEALSGLPPVPRVTRRNAIDDFTRDEAKRLWSEGTPKAQIADKLGIHVESVYRILTPGFAEKHRKNNIRKQRRRREAQLALKEKERTDAIKKASGNISAAYGYVRKAAVELDAALGDATSGEVRTALRTALASVHKAEDEIGKAVRSQ